MIYIGAWHKTGTNAIKKLFKIYQEKTGLNFEFQGKLDVLSNSIIENAKVIVCIRNPYEIIMSGMRYHQITTEKWCINPNNDGISYQDEINSFESVEEKILFEMKKIGGLTITNMYNFIKNKTQYEVYSKADKTVDINKNILIIKLEDFMTEEGRTNIVSKITDHVPILDKNILSNCIKIHGRKKFNKTNPLFSDTYQEYFTDEQFISL